MFILTLELLCADKNLVKCSTVCAVVIEIQGWLKARGLMTTKLSAVRSFLFAMFGSIQALVGQIPLSGLPSLRGRPLSPLVSGPKAPGLNRPLPGEQLPSNSFQRVRGGHGIEVRNSRPEPEARVNSYSPTLTRQRSCQLTGCLSLISSEPWQDSSD